MSTLTILSVYYILYQNIFIYFIEGYDKVNIFGVYIKSVLGE